MTTSPARGVSPQSGALGHELRKDGLDNPFSTPIDSPALVAHRKTSSTSISFADQLPRSQTPSPYHGNFEFENLPSQSQGLGISRRPHSISRVPVGARNHLSPQGSKSSLASTTAEQFSADSNLLSSKPTLDVHTNVHDARGQPTMSENHGDISSCRSTPCDDQLRNGGQIDTLERERRSLVESHDGGGRDDKFDIHGCPSKRDIHSSRKHWLSISILFLSLYSTVFSGIYLVIALRQPRYGRIIQSGGKLTPETASVLFALFAKTIELSFVGVFVAFLGQVLSRRSLAKASRGITIAEMTMRTWVIQPAYMFTHWQTLKHAGLSFLGMITLTNALVAMFYTTASDSLVSPHLKYGKWEDKVMFGTVKTTYANPAYIANLCDNPTANMDPQYGGTSCLAVLHSGQAFNNYISFLDRWTDIKKNGEGIPDNQRPQATAMLFDNTTVTGSWVSREWSNMTWSYESYKRIVNNVTMAMPHVGIFDAARDEQNGILQPENLAGVGEYKIRASVVSPVVNVLCVNMNEAELKPLIYVNWPNASINLGDQIPGQRLPKPGYDYRNDIQPSKGQNYLNSTVVDDIFEWGEKYGHQPPVFPMYPIEYNSVLNASVPYAYTDSVYALFKAPNTTTTDYTLCKLRSMITSECSTSYNVSGTSGGELRAHCEDPGDAMAYKHSTNKDITVPAKDWINVASQLLTSLSLNTGVSNLNASSSRLISQLVTPMPETGLPKLNPLIPSIAESLAVMAGSSLLLSITDASFYHYWNYSETILQGTQLPFNASIQSQEYTSGYIQDWTIMFYIILVIAFGTNVFCLVYFFIRSGLVTDFSEPQNLFALAINSPPSRRLDGSCGAGPGGKQLSVDWHISQDEGSAHFYIKEGDRRVDAPEDDISLLKSKRRETSYSKLSTRHRSFL